MAIETAMREARGRHQVGKDPSRRFHSHGMKLLPPPQCVAESPPLPVSISAWPSSPFVFAHLLAF